MLMNKHNSKNLMLFGEMNIHRKITNNEEMSDYLELFSSYVLENQKTPSRKNTLVQK